MRFSAVGVGVGVGVTSVVNSVGVTDGVSSSADETNVVSVSVVMNMSVGVGVSIEIGVSVKIGVSVEEIGVSVEELGVSVDVVRRVGDGEVGGRGRQGPACAAGNSIAPRKAQSLTQRILKVNERKR